MFSYVDMDNSEKNGCILWTAKNATQTYREEFYVCMDDGLYAYTNMCKEVVASNSRIRQVETFGMHIKGLVWSACHLYSTLLRNILEELKRIKYKVPVSSRKYTYLHQSPHFQITEQIKTYK